jgi:lipoprotein NlpD
LLALVVLLGACGEAHVVHRDSSYRESRETPPATRHAGAGEIEVARGDTLYGIAFRHGMDFRDLAAINGIDAPSTIYVGQILKLRGSARVRTPTVAQAPPRSRSTPATQQPVPSAVHPPRPASQVSAAPSSGRPAPSSFESVPPASATASMAKEAASSTVSTQVAAAPPAQPLTAPPAPMHAPAIPPVKPPRVAPGPAVVPTPSAAILPADVATVGGVHWRWPARGNLLDRFMAGDATKQGIDIGGNAGEPVVAASDGVVVYSGSGLVGYGELGISKHSDEWLSAYGHNRKRLVQEGQRVKAGQPIAEMGSTGAPRDELHFEIRRNGRPVDPLQFLPAH